ncbi:hypothetical protein JCM19237_6099 [Photobacterium aphoticum]|uniref:Outer membrane protein beta-barrel domain-containing protein n=1 Tax=Photobacterium aphoticum TaxID=754436 RepID=A0A090QJV8_9GAMM|nr:hypothetical protein JCM19237_6099 [Photobacterium aphoticum]
MSHLKTERANKKTLLGCALCLSLLPATVWAEATDAPVVESEKNASQYFFGVRGGGSLMGNDDSAVFANGGTVDSDDGGIGAFGAFDIGMYMPNDTGRVYYSFEFHRSTTQFEGKDAYDTQAMLHVISADHFFQPDLNVRPFVGLHFGYAFAETDSEFPDSYDDSGIVFGVQAGLGWEVTQRLALEVGLRHTMMPSTRRSWQAETESGEAVTVESQLKGVSSAYAGVNYRF